VKTNNTWNGSYTERNPIWGKARRETKSVMLTQSKTGKGLVPDVTGMGARDAVFLLENIGVKAKVRGRGKVKSQSIFAGPAAKQGMVCELVLEN
jgi:cell division protein FtsI (penicillin-binding protein 3)